MAQLTNIFLSSQRSAQSISVDNRSSVIRSNRSIITTGRGLTPANIFTLPSDRQSESGRQPDLKQVSASTLNRIPRVVGRCVTGGTVIDRYVVPGSEPTKTSYIVALSHTHITSAFTGSGVRDVRTDNFGTNVLSYCVTQIELLPTNSVPIRGHNCCNNGTPQIFYNGSLCVFGSEGVVIGLADIEDLKLDPTNYKTINSNFKVAVYQGNTAAQNQIFPPGISRPASDYARIPAGTNLAGLVFAVITVTDDPDLDISGLGEWRFGIDNSENYLPEANINTRERFNNPSNILKAYLTDTRYGVALNPDFLDDDSFESWRINCDLDVFNGGAYGTNPGQWIYYDPDNSSGTPTADRFMETNNAINSSLSVGENIKRITQSGLAQLHWDHETQVFRVIQSRGVRIPDIKDLFNFNSNNILGEINITSGDFFNLPTFATVNYPDRRLNSDTNAIRMEVSESDRLQNEPENGVQFTFPMINGRARAQTMANISLYENRNDEVIEFTGDYTTRDTQVGEYVTVTDAHQGLDTQVVRLIKITEELTPEGGLFYKYQAKKYSDKPYQPQVYSDDPNALGENYLDSQNQNIRIKEIIVGYHVDLNNMSYANRTIFNYASNNDDDVIPSSTSQDSVGAGYIDQYYGSAMAGGWIGFMIESTKAYHNAVKITVRRTDADYWSPEYQGHTVIVPGVIDGDPGYTGGDRRIVIRSSVTASGSQVQDLWRFGQSGQYTFDVESYYEQSYPYDYSNTWSYTLNNIDTWTETPGGFTTLPGGDTVIAITGDNASARHDLGKLTQDQYYVTVSATVMIDDKELLFGGGERELRPGYITASSFVDILGEVSYVNNKTLVEIPLSPANGNTTKTSYDDLYAYNLRKISTGARLNSDQMSPGGTYEISGQIPLDVWSGRSTYPGQADMNINTNYQVNWQLYYEDTGDIYEPDGQPTFRHPLQVTITDIKMSISNNSRMREE